MTAPDRSRRLSITLPEDVAKVLDDQPNASAYIAESLRMRTRRETALRVVRDAGYEITQEGVDRMRARLDEMAVRRRDREQRHAA
ncbi:hypothetical protein [Hamadaea tsunoensis]|uniref:hypothetical protein n=1 Tax=Hamadaea tsunoensis TaxID=53368 RepID=UPI000687BC1C|nr:hypothetical protein [Hamadaea tsunoensis]